MTLDALSRRLREAQRDQRLPAVSAAVVRDGDQLWADTVRCSADQAFRIGSITKTFTAALVLQCRDDGLLDLDDRLCEHLDVAMAKGATVRRALSHLAGVQREPVGDLWAGGPVPTDSELLAGLTRAEAELAPGRRFHYSNVAYALLGLVVAARRSATYASVLSERLLVPLGLDHTSLARPADGAEGGFTEPWTDHVVREPDLAVGALAPAAQLWSTAADVARWGGFLADPDPAVLAPATVAEMAEVAAMRDTDRWHVGYGLGLMLFRRGDRILLGHGGAMPGFLSAFVVDRETRTSSVVLTAAGRGASPDELAMRLLEDSLEAAPPRIEPWLPGEPAPGEVAGLLGHWWLEGTEVTVSWRGRLELRVTAAPEWRPPTVFASRGDGSWLTVQGSEAGEVLRPHADGSLRWATYALTRDPAPFADLV